MGSTLASTGAEEQRRRLSRVRDLKAAVVATSVMLYASLIGFEASVMVGAGGMAVMRPGQGGLAFMMFLGACTAGLSAAMGAAEGQRVAVVLTQSASEAASLPAGQELFGIARARLAAHGASLCLLAAAAMRRLTVGRCGRAASDAEAPKPGLTFHCQRQGGGTAVDSALAAVLSVGPVLATVGGVCMILSSLTLQALEPLSGWSPNLGLAGLFVMAGSAVAQGADGLLFVPGGMCAGDAPVQAGRVAPAPRPAHDYRGGVEAVPSKAQGRGTRHSHTAVGGLEPVLEVSEEMEATTMSAAEVSRAGAGRGLD